MKARLKTRITIHADPKAVFKYFGHTKYHHLWNPQIRTITPLTELSEGSVYYVQSQVLGTRLKAEDHITKFVPNKEIEIHNKTGMVQYCVNFRLEADEKGTHVICTSTVSSDSKTFAFARPMLDHLVRRELRADLLALKHAVEQKLEP